MKKVLNMDEDNDFKIEDLKGDSSMVKLENDEDLVDKELRKIKKSKKKKRRMNEDGSIVEEEFEDDEDDGDDAKSSSIDSLMADSPSKY
jgi:hypothetical protein